MRLFLELGVPVDNFPSKPVVRIELNGTLLEEWSSPPAVIEKEYDIPQARQGHRPAWRNSASVPPRRSSQNVNGVSADVRELGVVLRVVLWRPK
jgi:hypothetical protein